MMNISMIILSTFMVLGSIIIRKGKSKKVDPYQINIQEDCEGVHIRQIFQFDKNELHKNIKAIILD